MNLSHLLLVCLLCTSLVTYAGRESGGGDEEGLNFKNISLVVLSEFKKEFSDDYAKLALNNSEQIIMSTKVIVVDKDLELKIDGQVQNSVAINNPEDNSILISRKRWKEMSPVMKKGIALHEILSLVGAERTGYYKYTSAYVFKKGLAALEFISSAYEPYTCYSNAIKQGLGITNEALVQLCAGSSSATASIECYNDASSRTGWNDLAAQLLCSGAHTPKAPLECFDQMWTDKLFTGWTSENVLRTCRGSVSATKTIECIRNAYYSSKRLTIFGAALLCTGNQAQK